MYNSATLRLKWKLDDVMASTAGVGVSCCVCAALFPYTHTERRQRCCTLHNSGYQLLVLFLGFEKRAPAPYSMLPSFVFAVLHLIVPSGCCLLTMAARDQFPLPPSVASFAIDHPS
jgi:hypothetical protein